MFSTLIRLALLFKALEEVMANIAAAPSGECRHVTLHSELILTGAEHEAMATGSLDLQGEVALIRRGLIRQRAVAAG